MTVLTLFMSMQMPSPKDIVIYWPGPRAFSVVQKPWGWAHISVQKPLCARGRDGNQSNWYLHYCSPLSRSDYIFFTAQPMMTTGVLLFLLETRDACACTGKRMRYWTFMDTFGSFRRLSRIVTCYNWTSSDAVESLSCLQICSYHNLC